MRRNLELGGGLIMAEAVMLKLGASIGRLRRLVDHRSEEHTSELQSHVNLVCRLLLEKKKNNRVCVSLLDVASHRVSTWLARCPCASSAKSCRATSRS